MLRYTLVAHKDPLKPDEKCCVVYSMKCDTCDGEYLGETGRPLSTRIKGHKSPVFNKDMKSALEEHVLKKIGHKFEFV